MANKICKDLGVPEIKKIVVLPLVILSGTAQAKSLAQNHRPNRSPPLVWKFFLNAQTIGGELMWNEPAQAILDNIPRIYETEQIPIPNKLIYLHFFTSASDWYIAEYDGIDFFWGFVILDGDQEMAEWGYISFDEMRALRLLSGQEVDCDLYWQIRPAMEVDKIRQACPHW